MNNGQMNRNRFTFTSDCDVPLVSGLDIGFGWMAKETKFASNWDAMAWELYIDGYKLDLEGFDWYEYELYSTWRG